MSLAERIRVALKRLGPMPTAQVAIAVESTSKKASAALNEMKSGGYVRRSEDGIFHFIKDPAPPKRTSAKERREQWASSSRKRRAIAARNPKLKIISVTKAKPEKVSPPVSTETVAQFLARGGRIELAPVKHTFERLTRDDIMGGSYRVSMGFQSPVAPRLSREGGP